MDDPSGMERAQMIMALVTILTFLSTFFAMLHFTCSFFYRREPRRRTSRRLGFSLIIPCYNEAPILANTIRGVLNLEWEDYEAIFINDGSTDDTMRVFFEQLDMEPYEPADPAWSSGFEAVYRSRAHPNIYLIDKHNSGKAASLNDGIRFSAKELIVTLDGDSVLEKDALQIMNQPFQDGDVIASGGAVHVMQYFLMEDNGRAIISLQALDYIKGFYIYKPSLCHNNALNIISGAFGVFRKDALVAVGGFRDGLGEDIDITIRLQAYALERGKSITYTMDAICYTECPQTWKDLRRQRIRWQKAFLGALVNNRAFLMRHFFRSCVCFFMLADAAFSGTMAVLAFCANFFLIALRVICDVPLLFIVFVVLAVLFNILGSVVAIERAARFGPYTFREAEACAAGRKRVRTARLYWIIWMELSVFSFLRIWFFLRGTASFLMKKESWDKLKRTDNVYTA